MTSRFTGVIPPMITPLTADEEIDLPAVRRIVNFTIEGGVDGLFILGSNGEGAVLRRSACQALAEATVEAAAGRVPVMAGVLETSTARVIEGMRALSGRGLDAYVVTNPFYFSGFNNAELVDHFRRAAEAADLPVLAYNIPQNTKACMNADAVMKLMDVPNIAGIKDSSGDWTEFQAILSGRTNPDFVVLQGMQSLAAVSLIAGADGLVPGHANVYPQLLAKLVMAVKQGDLKAAFGYQKTLDGLAKLRGRAFIHSYKLLCQALGLMEDYTASPLPRMNPDEAKRFLAAAVAAGMPLPNR